MSEILVVPEADDVALLEEAHRIAEALGGDDGGTRDGAGRPSVVAVAFEGLVDPEELAAGSPDEIVHAVPEGDAADGGGSAFEAGAAGVRSRAAALAAVARDVEDGGSGGDDGGRVRAVLLPDTPDGADLAAATASRLRSGCVTDCLLRVRDGELSAGRAAYGGRAYAEIDFEREPPVATLNREALGTPSAPATGSPTVRTVEVAVERDDRVRHVETVDVPESDLAKARRIVAGGFGLGGPDGFGLVENLAESLGAAVGASRPPADEEWVPYDRQIGVTGKEIDVELYVPLAISGDSYHMRSVNAEYLIPINSDPDARIFNFADVGIVGDAYEYAPALADAVRAAVGETDEADASDTGDETGEETNETNEETEEVADETSEAADETEVTE
ncbi:FAD-binding protein [Halobellus sp. GM3]|uniref:FAD-binding protein n=1 Tax=Halobellus sp. GM3 TaxID=3458410 RepID=UPI00403E343B